MSTSSSALSDKQQAMLEKAVATALREERRRVRARLQETFDAVLNGPSCPTDKDAKKLVKMLRDNALQAARQVEIPNG